MIRNSMRRNIVHTGADELVYEIRQIVALAEEIETFGVEIIYENIGDPIPKGEKIPDWIKDIVVDLVKDDSSWGYAASQGDKNTRNFLATKVNERGGAQITANDIYFFNGLGDAVAKIFGFLRREARILGPSPAYSTLSSAEAAHSGYEHLTYDLLPEQNWMPDLQDIENKIKYNDSIAGILLINPDNPTGAVYSKEMMKKIVDICKRYDCMLICDETYAHINYSEEGTIHLSEVIGDEVPAMSLRSISKEFPWPGGRCGWIEVFNQKKDALFERYIKSLLDAKMLEVSSTTLPQRSIPLVYGDDRFLPYMQMRNEEFKKRAKKAAAYFKDIEGVTAIEPKGAFYISVIFNDGVLTNNMSLEIANSALKDFILPKVENAPADKRFIIYLLAATGICVVPMTSFCSPKNGFRATLLETDSQKFEKIFKTLRDSIIVYLASDKTNFH